MYQIIPRKYRPQTFHNVVGQDPVVATLKNALLHKRLAQAYLFCGSKGTGKTSLARLFAKALNCAQLSEDQEPCNQCPSCIEITGGHSLSVLEIDGASNRGIDDIRQINDTVAYASASGKYKIYIIDEVHMLTKEAFNALLKTLEEPPPHVKFFFATTEPHKILPTIISRCQRFDLSRIPPEAMRKKLIGIVEDLGREISPQALDILVEMSEGALRDAESHLDQVLCYTEGVITEEIMNSTFGITPKTTYEALDRAVISGDLPFAFTLAEQVFSSGDDLSTFMDGLVQHYRSLLRVLLADPTAHPSFTSEQCLYIIEFLLEWGYKLSKTPFKHVALETLLLHLIQSSRRVSLDTLVHRLLALEQTFATPLSPALISEKVMKKETPIPVAKSPPPPIEEAPKVVQNQIAPEKPLLKEEVKETPAPIDQGKKSHYDTLLRFAAVELEGIVER